MDIIIGAIISIIGTFVFNLWLSSRAESKRWDAYRLRALTDARIDFQRALGAIEVPLSSYGECRFCPSI
jgi:hypothetical protein